MKDGNKNRLREQDIHKIVDVFNRQFEIEKYSRMVSVTEIEKNDFNLNIPRYVNTFEPEPPVDMPAVNAEIRDLRGRLVEVEERMEDYLRELGLDD